MDLYGHWLVRHAVYRIRMTVVLRFVDMSLVAIIL